MISSLPLDVSRNEVPLRLKAKENICVFTLVVKNVLSVATANFSGPVGEEMV